MKNIIFCLTTALIFVSIPFLAKADFNKDGIIEVPKDFDRFTSNNLKGYTKPFFTTIEQGAQSNLYTVASYDESYSIGMDFSLSSTLIPNSQKVYDAELPAAFGDTKRMDNAAYVNGKVIRNISGKIEQPTIYGGPSNAIYVVSPVPGGDPADSIYKTIAFNEGNDITTMASLPAFQLIIGLPTRTEIRFRYLGAPIEEETISNISFIVNQQLDHWLNLFNEEDKMALALNASYQTMSLGNTLDLSSWAVGLHFSKDFGDGFSLYSGLQLENLSGKFKLVRANGYNPDFYVAGGDSLKSIIEIPKEQQIEYMEHVQARKEVEKNPFEEVRLLKPLSFDIESFTNWRLVLGASYEYGIMELHLDLGYASQPFLNGGIRLRFKEWKNSSQESSID